MNLSEPSQALGAQMLAGLAHRGWDHLETTRLRDGVGDCERGDNPAAFEEDAIEVTHLFHSASLSAELSEHPLPNVLRDDDHAAGRW